MQHSRRKSRSIKNSTDKIVDMMRVVARAVVLSIVEDASVVASLFFALIPIETRKCFAFFRFRFSYSTASMCKEQKNKARQGKASHTVKHKKEVGEKKWQALLILNCFIVSYRLQV